MPGIDLDDGGRSAESALEVLLRPWHVEGEGPDDRAGSQVDRALAFLPRASRHSARSPIVRLAFSSLEDVPASLLDLAPGSAASAPVLPPHEETSRSFEDVSNAIAKRRDRMTRLRAGAGSDTRDEFAADTQSFAARIGALETARRLEHPAEAGPPRPEGCFERYRDVVDDRSFETEQGDAHVDDLSAVFNINLMSFGHDGDVAGFANGGAPARLGLRAIGEDELGEPPANAIFL